MIHSRASRLFSFVRIYKVLPIRQWQATHPASVNAPAEIIAALKANGFNASPFMYGNTPSGNEINLNGEKFKVIGAENSGNPTWYRGENDLPGGGGFSLSGGSSVAPWQAPGILTPYGKELTMPTQAELEAAGTATRVVSMVCCEKFDAQDAAYQHSVLGDAKVYASIEAGATYGWDKYVGRNGVKIGIDEFGASAPAKDLYKHFGVTCENLVSSVKEKL